MSVEKNYPALRANILSRIGDLNREIPEAMHAFSALHKSAIKDGALGAKTKELMALAISVAAKCDGCVAFHTHDALRAGASTEEIAETLSVAVMMGGGPSMVYATHALDAVAQFEQS